MKVSQIDEKFLDNFNFWSSGEEMGNHHHGSWFHHLHHCKIKYNFCWLTFVVLSFRCNKTDFSQGQIETFDPTLRPIHVHEEDSNPGHFHAVTTPAPIVSSLPPRKHFPHLIHETVYSTTTTRKPTIHTTQNHQLRPSNIYDAISSLPKVNDLSFLT